MYGHLRLSLLFYDENVKCKAFVIWVQNYYVKRLTEWKIFKGNKLLVQISIVVTEHFEIVQFYCNCTKFLRICRKR